MAGAFINVTVDDVQMKSLFDKVLRQAHNLQPAMNIIGEHLTNSVRENFVQSGRPNRWKPLSPATLHGLIGGSRGYTLKGTLRAKSKRTIAGKQILIGKGMSGGLMGSIHYQSSGDSVDIGTDKVYGAIHQLGGMAGRGRKVAIPARPYLMVQDEDWPKMVETISEWIMKGVRHE